MGIEDMIEKAAGAFAAEKALESVDPNAGTLAKVAAVVAGFEGVGAVKDHLAQQAEPQPEQAQAGDVAAQADDESQNSQM